MVLDHLGCIYHTRPVSSMLTPSSTHDTIKQKQFMALGLLILETNQCVQGPDGTPFPIRKGLYDAMLCGDFTSILNVAQSAEDRG
jgi:hypothetical protein